MPFRYRPAHRVACPPPALPVAVLEQGRHALPHLPIHTQKALAPILADLAAHLTAPTHDPVHLAGLTVSIKATVEGCGGFFPSEGCRI